MAGDGVTVTWRPGNAAPGVTYAVRPVEGGDQEQTSGTSAAFTGLTPGIAYRFAVTATNAAGTSDESAPSNPVTIPVPPPGAPTNLALTKDGEEGNTGLTMWVRLAWTQPDLGGGQLVKYVVRGVDRNGNAPAKLVKETTTTTAEIVNGYSCDSPFTYEVRAVTRSPATGEEQTGPAATVTTRAHSCAITMAVTAQAAGPNAATVTLRKTGGRDYVKWPCSLRFNGDTKWEGTCPGTGAPVTVPGLDPATAYQVVLQVDQTETTTTDPVTVTTPAA